MASKSANGQISKEPDGSYLRLDPLCHAQVYGTDAACFEGRDKAVEVFDAVEELCGALGDVRRVVRVGAGGGGQAYGIADAVGEGVFQDGAAAVEALQGVTAGVERVLRRLRDSCSVLSLVLGMPGHLAPVR